MIDLGEREGHLEVWDTLQWLLLIRANTSFTDSLRGNTEQKLGQREGEEGQHRAGQRRGQDRTGQDRTGQDRTGQDRTGQDRTGQDRTR